jgi:serine/threonine-protein kinase
MSPEQVRGQALDKRTDIWSFGCVLYEMLAGKRAFAGETVSDTLAAILKERPDWEALPPSTPLMVRALLRRCLRRDPARRLHDIADARIEIEEALHMPAPEAKESYSGALSRPSPSRLAWIGGLIAVVALVAGYFVGGWQPGPQAPSIGTTVSRYEISLPRGYEIGQGLAISPDGRTLVYPASRGGEGRLFRRSLDRLDSEPIPGTEDSTDLPAGGQGRGGLSPFFFPGGDWVGFGTRVPNALKKVRLSGGPVVHVAGLRSIFRGAAWEPPDHLIVGQHEGGLLRLPAAGGQPQSLTLVEDQQRAAPHRYPQVLPDDRGILFTIFSSPEGDQIAVLPAEASDWRRVTEGWDGRYVPTGHLVFWREGSLWAAPFDLEQLELTGEATPVVADVRAESGLAFYTWSPNGALFYVPAAAPASRMLVWVDRQGNEEPFSIHRGPYEALQLSPGEGTLLIRSDANLWLHDVQRDVQERLTADSAAEYSAVWSPEGEDVAFTSRRSGPFGAYRSQVSGARSVEAVGLGTGNLEAWTQEGLVYWSGGSLRVWSLANQQSEILFEEGIGSPGNAAISGRYLAYVATQDGRRYLAVRPWPDVNANRWLVAAAEATSPRWSRDGRELFYRVGTAMMAVRLAETPGGPSFGVPEKLFDGTYAAEYDVASDGRFVMIRDADAAAGQGPDRIIVVQNWFEELKRLVPTPGS